MKTKMIKGNLSKVREKKMRIVENFSHCDYWLAILIKRFLTNNCE